MPPAMDYLKKIILLTLIVIFSCCSANKDSFHQSGEVVEITLNKYPEQGILATGLSVAAPVLLDYGVGKIKQLLEKEANKFTAVYTGEISDSNFYRGVSDEKQSLNYESITIVRKAQINGKIETVSNITMKLQVDESGTFLMLQPHSLKIDKSKAKLVMDDNTLDIKIDISMVSFWVGADQEYRTQETANTSFLLSNIELGRTYTTTDTELQRSSGWLFPVPLSRKTDNSVYGKGTFNLVITVTEVDDYGKRIEKIRSVLETNEEQLRDLILSNIQN